MKTVELSAALGQAQVVENLKNFVGVDAQGAAALMTPERLAAVAGGLTHANKKLLTAKDDLNNISDGWYYFINADNPANTARNADNSLLYQTSFPTGRKAKFQFIFCENNYSVLFRQMGHDGQWKEWKIIQSLKY